MPSVFVSTPKSKDDSCSYKAMYLFVNLWDFLRGIVFMTYSSRDLEAHRVYDKTKKPCCPGTIYGKVKITVLIVISLGLWFSVFDPYMRRLGTEK